MSGPEQPGGIVARGLLRRRSRPRQSAAEYRQWLATELGLPPVDDPAPLVAAAQQRHKAAFDAWMAQFV